MDIGGIRLSGNVLPEDYLELSNKVFVKNLEELIAALEKMNKNDFELHVTKSRNDFAEWILEAYNNEKITQKLLKTLDKNKIILILKNAVKENKINEIKIPTNKKKILESIGKLNNGGM